MRGVRSIVMSMSVHLSVRSHNLKTTWPNFANFLCMLPMAMVWSSSDGVVISYVLLMLCITLYFHIMALRCIVCILKWQ